MVIAVAALVAGGSTLIGVPPSSAATTTTGNDVISTVVGGGSNAAITDGIVSTSANLGSPLGGVLDSHGNVVFADQNNNVIRVAAAVSGTFYGHSMIAGHIYTIIGNGQNGDVGDGTGNMAAVEFSGPSAVVIDAQGDIIITDTDDDAVRMVAATGGLRYGEEMAAGDIYTIAGGGEEGEITPGGSAFSAGLTGPDGLAVDAQGDVYIADTGDDLIRFVPAAARTVFGMAVQPGHIYTLAGNGNYGYTGDGGPGPSAQLQLDTFNGVAVDANGDAIFSDVDNQVVRMVAANTGTYLGRAVTAGYIYTIAGNGHEGFAGNKKPATKAWLDTPQGVAIDSAGNLLISDSVNNDIRLVPSHKETYDGMAVKAGDIYTIAGNRTAGYTGNPAAATSSELNEPAGLSVGPSGNLLVFDNGNNVIREITGPAPLPPSVSALKPASGPTTGDRKVSIIGANLSGVTAVMFGSRPALSFTVKSNKKVIAYSPASATGRVTIRVYSPVGVNAVTSVDSYTYQVGAAKKHRRRL
jgi:sugar lactone lactonase YvrE